jgi:FkbM family methyltransferase
MWGQILDNKLGKINTWAIFWYATIFKRNGLCLSPSVSFTRNIGFDGTGIHCGTSEAFSSNTLCEKDIDLGTIKIEEDKKAVKKIMYFYKKLHKKTNLLIRYCNKLVKIIRTLRKYLDKIFKIIRQKRLFKCKYKQYGNDYGGFNICYELLNPSPDRKIIVYSAGVGEDISFDEAIMDEFNCQIFAFDPTPKSIQWIQKQKLPENFIFHPIGISNKAELQRFFLPKNQNYISASTFDHDTVSVERNIMVQMKTLENIAMEYHHTYVDVLKMDIEGSEFSVLNALPDNIFFGQIVVEFHERFIKHGEKILMNTIHTLKRKGYHCFAISEHGDEYSFLNKKLYLKRGQFF